MDLVCRNFGIYRKQLHARLPFSITFPEVAIVPYSQNCILHKAMFLSPSILGKAWMPTWTLCLLFLGKKGISVVNRLNKGLATYIDKKKALAYLHLVAPIATASEKQELSSAAKIVNSFENPKHSRENFRRLNDKQMQDERPEPPREEVKPAERSRKAYIERKTRNALATVRAMCCASADNWFCVNIFFWQRSSVTN